MAVPKSYDFKFIEPGIMSYRDTEAKDIVLVSREALDNMAKSFKGCPIILVPELHGEQDKENSFNFDEENPYPPVGIITGVPRWADDGFQYVEGLVWDEEAQNVLDKAIGEFDQGKEPSASCSCAYDADLNGMGGIWHELEFNDTVLGGDYKHMAIVPKPRYEGSRVLANSRGEFPGEETSKGESLNIFKKKNASPPIPAKEAGPEKKAVPLAGKENPAEEKAELMNDDTEIDVNGTPVPLHELVAKYEESKGIGGGAPLGDEDEVGLSDGSKVTVADLKAAWGTGEPSGEPLENAEAPTDVTADPVVDETKQRANSAPVRKVNQALKNSASSMGYAPEKIETQAGRLERGTQRYSLPVRGNAKGGSK